MAASTSSPSSDSYSSDSSYCRRRRSHRRRRRADRNDVLKVRKKCRSRDKRRSRRRHSRDHASSSSDSDSREFSSDSECESSDRWRKHKIIDRPKMAKEESSKRHRQRNRNSKHKTKEEEIKRSSSPIQLSKFLGRDKEEEAVRRSAVSGRKILLKLHKSKEDKLAENNRSELLKFLNASYGNDGAGADH